MSTNVSTPRTIRLGAKTGSSRVAQTARDLSTGAAASANLAAQIAKARAKRVKVSRMLVRSLVVYATRDDALTFPLPDPSTVRYFPFTKLPGKRF